MVDYTDSFNEHSDILRKKQERSDFDNLQHTLSDVETGQQTKHGLQKDEVDPFTGEKKRGSVNGATKRTLDWLLLNDTTYKLAHENLITSIRQAQHDTQTVLERVTNELSGARRIMDELRASAAKLPDGTRVFKDRHGNVRGEDGEIIPSERAAGIEWRGGEPSYEKYQAQDSHIENLESAERELRGIDNELGEIHERNTRNKNPLTIEEKRQDIDRANALGERTLEIGDNLSQVMNNKPTIDHSENENALESDKKLSITLPTIKNGG